MRILMCCAVAFALIGCSSSKHAAAPAGGSTAPTVSTTTPVSTTTGAGATPSSTDAATTTTGGASGGDPKPTGAFCADVRNGAVQTALGDAANPNPAASSLDDLKKVDSEAPSAIKSSVDVMLRLLTQIQGAGTDEAKQNTLAADGVQLQTAATTIGNYITAHC